jgi:hypothetical protein
MQMQNLVVLAGSGTSLGKPGAIMKDLWISVQKAMINILLLQKLFAHRWI